MAGLKKMIARAAYWSVACCVDMWGAASAAAAAKASTALTKDEIASCGIACRSGRRHQRRRDQVRETMTAAIEFSADGFLQQINEYECIRDVGFGAMTEVSSFLDDYGFMVDPFACCWRVTEVVVVFGCLTSTIWL